MLKQAGNRELKNTTDNTIARKGWLVHLNAFFRQSANSEHAPLLNGEKKIIGERSRPSVAWGRKKAREPLDFVYIMIWLDRSLTFDKWVMNVDKKYPVDLLMFNANFLWWNTIFIFKQAIVYIWGILIADMRWMHLIFTHNWLVHKTAYTVHVFIAYSWKGWSRLTGYKVFLQKSFFKALLRPGNLIV